ncbi:sulfotransferase family 2 domain-containing protein [Thermodesulfobacteriota bacterium]
MIPVVNEKFRYIFFYNPKSACSTYRQLYLELHCDELAGKTKQRDHNLHNVDRLWPKKLWRSYKDYYKYSIVRNPYSRIVSAFLDKCFEYKYQESVRYRHKKFIKSIHRPIFHFLNKEINFQSGYSFVDTLKYLEATNNKQRDYHFREQFSVNNPIDNYYRIEDTSEKLIDIYHEIFQRYPIMEEKAVHLIKKLSPIKMNLSVNPCGDRKFEGCLAYKNFSELEEIKRDNYSFDYSLFYDEQIKELIKKIYLQEIEYFGYSFPY